MKTLQSTLFPAHCSGKAASLPALVVAAALLSETPLVANGTGPGGSPPAVIPKKDVADMDLMELARVRVVSATLTPTAIRLVPAQTTDLDELTIRRSGVRTLNELLEIYAPNTQVILHQSHLEHLGVRGIIGDREDKYLLRVNGRVMNNHFLLGAERERDLPLMGDFREVSLVHGPGSATYGAGALAGVLNLETHTGMTFEGADVQVRHGFRDEFTACEVRLGHRFSEDSALFLYAGVADQPGANQDDAPYVFGKSFTTAPPSTVVRSGEPVDYPVANLRDQGDLIKLKLHGSYVNGPVEVWTRYTQGGGLVRPQRPTLETVTNLYEYGSRGNENRQFTAATRYRQQVTEAFHLDAMASYDWYEHLYVLPDIFKDPQQRREQEAYARLLGTWTPAEEQSLALGVEYSHEWFDGPRLILPMVEDAWQTDTISFMAEHQYHWNRVWTTFLSGRVDKQTYTGWLFSPRVAVVCTPAEKDTFKFIAAQAVRRSGDGELRQEYVQSRTKGGTETLGSLELRYERQQTKHLNLSLSAFVEDSEAIGYDASVQRSIPVGEFKIWGLEPEITWRSDSTRVALSHGFTQLFDSSLATATTIQGITAAPYGFGNDLANWANNITKLAVIQELGAHWTASTSLRVYWGFPGMEALADWNDAQTPSRNFALDDPGYNKAYGPSVYWNAGLEFRPTKHLTLRLDAFNILGWVDTTLNKRLYIYRGSEYSVEAASVAFSARLAF